MRRAAAVVLILFSAGALAHPGHGVVDLWHLLTEPDHLALLLLPVVIALAIKWGQSPFKRNRGRTQAGGRSKPGPAKR